MRCACGRRSGKQHDRMGFRFEPQGLSLKVRKAECDALSFVGDPPPSITARQK